MSVDGVGRTWALTYCYQKIRACVGKIWNQRQPWYRSATSVQRFRVVNVKVQSRQRMFKSRRAVWGFKRSDGVIFLPRRIFVQSVHVHVCKTRAISDRASEEATKAVTEAWRLECMMFEMVMSWGDEVNKKPRSRRIREEMSREKPNQEDVVVKPKQCKAKKKDCDESRRWSLVKSKTRRRREELKEKAQTKKRRNVEDQDGVVS